MIKTVLIASTQSLNPRRVFAGLWKQSENNVTCDWESQTACQAVVLHHSTTSPTTLLGCWAKFRAGLPPYRSGLVDGKCVWRLSRRVSLTPLCIACLDLTSATSGRDHVTHRSSHRTSASALSGPFSFFFFFFPSSSSSINSSLSFRPIIRQVQITETEAKWQKWDPAPATHGCIKARLSPAKTSSPLKRFFFSVFFLVTAVTRLNIRLILKNYGDDGKNLIEKLNISK